MADLKTKTRDDVRQGAIDSALGCMPRILLNAQGVLGELPGSVLDVGCGEGHWLDAARLILPVADLHGVDLPSVYPATRDPGRGWSIDSWDAESGEPLPTRGVTPLEWSVALCLEVAEHVSHRAGAHLVRELCRVSRQVVWSAAIPGQGGDGHVNEQWPAYWAEAFDACGWHLEDPWRWGLWGVADVEPWYQQNLLLALPGRRERGEWPHHLVHPVTWAYYRGVSA